MKPRNLEMKSNDFVALPVSGLERSPNDRNTHPGRISFVPGWAKKSRRPRAKLGNPGTTIPAFDQAWISILDSNQGLSGSDVGDFQVMETVEQDVENLPPKKRKLDSVFPNGPNRSSAEIDMIHSPGPKSSKRLKDLNASDDIRAPNNIHTCDICDRAFRSYQALGGHKSHHNIKAHQRILSTREGNESSTTVVDSVVVYGQWPKAQPGGVMHKCPFCDREFSKGQALGGHKRHCRRAVNGSLCHGGGHETGRGPGPGLDFDLNELPLEWVQGEMGNFL